VRILVTGSAGHLGEALARLLAADGHRVVGADVVASAHTTHLGSITDPRFVEEVVDGADAILHTAALHKPHVATRSRRDFVETNVTATLGLLEEAVATAVGCFVFTSTTSAFGRALTPAQGERAVWVTEDLVPRPRNIYGATKVAAEDLCELIHRDHGLPCVVLRTARFFPEADDRAEAGAAFTDPNLKVNELLFRRADLADVAAAHRCALERAPAIGFSRYVISASSPFTEADLDQLAVDAPAVVERYFPGYIDAYRHLGWRMCETIDRVYVNARARADLGWEPSWDFGRALEQVADGKDPWSHLAQSVGAKGYGSGPAA
jgi:nucleoside-diphosphate-sugar epimerase